MSPKKSAKSQEQGFDNPPEELEQAEAAEENWEEPSEVAEGEAEEQKIETEDLSAQGFSDDILQSLAEAKNWLMQQAVPVEGRAFAAEELEGTGNVVGVGLGYSEAGLDLAPGTACLNVYVEEPMDTEAVRAVMVEAMGVSAASSDANTPINVVVTGPIDAQPHRFRIRPAPGGVSVGHFRITCGTLGCLSTGRHAPRDRRLLILSNNHVLANSNASAYGDPVLQPGACDGGTNPADRIAIRENFVPIYFDGRCNYIDAACAWAWPSMVRREMVYWSRGLHYFRVSSGPRNCARGMLVGKTGRTTQLTVGRILDCNASVRVNYGNGRAALFCDQIVIQGLSTAFSAGGDSGSLIWTWDNARNPVGLLFAGNSTVTIANKITRVLAALDIRLYT